MRLLSISITPPSKMGLLLLMVITATYYCQAQKSSKLQTRVTLTFTNNNAIQVLKSIEHNSKLNFCYNANDIDKKVLITLQFKKESLQNVLKAIGTVCKLKFLVINNTVSVSKNSTESPILIIK